MSFAVLLSVVFVWGACAQTPSPLGDTVSPKAPVDGPVQRVVPAGAVVRTVVSVGGPGPASMVIYDSAPTPPSYRPHIAVVEAGRLGADFDLEKLDEYLDAYVFITARALPIAAGPPAAVAAFRNAGDGAGTVFAIVIKWNSAWKLALLKRLSQAKLRVQDGGRVIEVIDPDEDSQECVWCAHNYGAEKFVLGPRGVYERTGSRREHGRTLPGMIALDPLPSPHTNR